MILFRNVAFFSVKVCLIYGFDLFVVILLLGWLIMLVLLYLLFFRRSVSYWNNKNRHFFRFGISLSFHASLQILCIAIFIAFPLDFIKFFSDVNNSYPFAIIQNYSLLHILYSSKCQNYPYL